MWYICDMDKEHLFVSASQGQNPDTSCLEGCVPDSGTEAGVPNTNANHIMSCADAEPLSYV